MQGFMTWLKRKKMREIGKSLALTAVAIAGLLLSAVPASAHDDKKTLWRGSGKVWFTTWKVIGYPEDIF
jgi:hypothetical protein